MRTVAVRRARPVAVVAVAGATLVASAVVGAGAANASDRGGITVVAKGLDNPRHLVVDERGDVYVAEAGRGAVDPKKAPCVKTVNPETDEPVTLCYGPTGAITRIHHGSAKRVVTGLPSVSDATGENAGGVTDLTTPDGRTAVAVVNLGADPRKRSAAVPGPALDSAGHLLKLDLRHDRFRIGADVAAYEAGHNPDHADPDSAYDSNPYAVAEGKDGTTLVADAGGNDLLAVDRRGKVRLVALFPARLVPAPAALKLPPGTRIPMQSVPNSVVKGPDGAWYVGELTGFPFVPGAARVWRIEPGHSPKVVAAGFTNIIDIAFDRHGRLLVLEIATRSLLDPKSPGALWQVDRHGDRKLVTDKLTVPGGLAVGRDGAAYVTNLSVLPGQGQVLRVPLR